MAPDTSVTPCPVSATSCIMYGRIYTTSTAGPALMLDRPLSRDLQDLWRLERGALLRLLPQFSFLLTTVAE